MKVLTLWSSRYKGGCAKRFVELVAGLAARQIGVTVLTNFHYPNVDTVQTKQIPFPTGRFRVLKAVGASKCQRCIESTVDECNPDVLFAFGLANSSLLGRVARSRSMPFVVFIRGMELVLGNNQNIPWETIPGLAKLGRAIYSVSFRVLSRRVFRNADAVVFQHEEQQQAYLRERMFKQTPSQTVHFLPNNANPSWMAAGDTSSRDPGPVTLMAANLYWNKGFRVAFDAFRIVRAHVPQARLVILGSGPQGSEIERQGRLVGGIEFQGHVPDVFPYFRCARVLLHATLDELGSPNIVLEAAAYGLPMIVSDEVVHTVGRGPGVYPKYDAEDLAKLWIKALRDDNFLGDLRQVSRELADRYRFDWVGAATSILQSASK